MIAAIVTEKASIAQTHDSRSSEPTQMSAASRFSKCDTESRESLQTKVPPFTHEYFRDILSINGGELGAGGWAADEQMYNEKIDTTISSHRFVVNLFQEVQRLQQENQSILMEVIVCLIYYAYLTAYWRSVWALQMCCLNPVNELDI